jgi:DNA-binding XRE family transcriptional regulator
MHLDKFMAKSGHSDEQVAQEIGVTRETISRIRRRKYRPDWPTIQALKRWSGGEITADDFLDIGRN